MDVNEQQLFIHLLKKLMHEKRWSQKELAEDLNFGRVHICLILSGRRKINKRFEEFLRYYLVENNMLKDPYQQEINNATNH